MSTNGATTLSRARALPRALRVRLVARRLCADRASRDRLVALLAAGRFAPPGEPEPVALAALGGAPVHLRPGAADADVLISAFHGRYHLPAAGLAPPALIWDLGANIGLTALQLARQFPAARIVAVELDSANIELAARNIAPVRDRVELIEGAVWTDPGTLEYGTPSGGGEDSFRVSESGTASAAAVTLDELRDRFGAPDYVKMDIEGAEREVLARNTAWAAAVPRINVEYHAPYDGAACRRDLAALGFGAFEEHRRGLRYRGGDCIFAAREDVPAA